MITDKKLFSIYGAKWPPVWERSAHSVHYACLSCTFSICVCMCASFSFDF